jgi:transglutaminase-like putative cysteine protease
MKLKVACGLSFQISEPTAFILMLRPYRGEGQTVKRESYTIQPCVDVTEHTDSYGNACQRLLAPPGRLVIEASADVKVAEYVDVNFQAGFVEIQYLPSAVLGYLVPSRYCESDRLSEQAIGIVGNAQPGYCQVDRIAAWIRSHVQYLPGSSETPLSAVEILHRGHGVCRDLAHLGIALCRSISIPARIVVGYLHHLSPMDLHAWFEAYVGGRWYAFDPSQGQLAGGRVVIAFGCDAAEVAIFHQFGPGGELTRMEVSVEQLEDWD